MSLLFVFCAKGTLIDNSAQHIHLEISLTDLLDSTWNVFLSQRCEHVNVTQCRFGKCITIKMTVCSVLFAIFCGALNQKLFCIQKRIGVLLTPSLGLSDLPA